MWKEIMLRYFGKYPAQLKIVQIMLSHGLSIKKGKIYCGDVELSYSKIARAAGVDRRAVMNVVEKIESQEELKKIFHNLIPTCHFREMATKMGWGVIEIIPVDASMPGILADVAKIIADENISIRQAIVDDYDIKDEPKLFIVTEKPFPSRLIKKLGRAKGVKGVIVY